MSDEYTAGLMIEDQTDYNPDTDFTCRECGHWVFRPAGVPEFKLCATCEHMPGWFTNPELRKWLDPHHPRQGVFTHRLTLFCANNCTRSSPALDSSCRTKEGWT